MRIFFDGMLTEPRLDHPEGIAVADDGAIWCGGEHGQIYRIEPDGSAIEQVATTGGFCLGLAFGPDRALYVCDIAHSAVFRLEPGTGRVERFAVGFAIPNVPAFAPDGTLFVSDSYAHRHPGPGVWRVDAEGRATLWFHEPLDFANGLVFAPGGEAVYVAETYGRRITRIPIASDGGPGRPELIAFVPEVLPDGIAFGPDGRLYVACYEPSRILRLDDGGSYEVFAADPDANLLCHPTNVAFRGNTMFAANLGRWHVTEVGVAA